MMAGRVPLEWKVHSTAAGAAEPGAAISQTTPRNRNKLK